MQAVIGTGSGDTYQVELDEGQVQAVTGMQIGDEVEGSVLGLNGYTLEITGGSDQEGFPMRETLNGTGRKKILAGDETGHEDLRSGERRRKSFRGNTVSEAIVQLNLRVVEAGSDDVATLLGEGDDGAEDADEGE